MGSSVILDPVEFQHMAKKREMKVSTVQNSIKGSVNNDRIKFELNNCFNFSIDFLFVCIFEVDHVCLRFWMAT